MSSATRAPGNFPAGGAAAAGLTAAVAPSGVPNIETAIQNLYSSSAIDVVKSLNYLLQKTSDVVADGNSILIEQYPTLLTALSDLLDVLNPVGNLVFSDKDVDSVDMIVDELLDTISCKHVPWQKLSGAKNDELKVFRCAVSHRQSSSFISPFSNSFLRSSWTIMRCS